MSSAGVIVPIIFTAYAVLLILVAMVLWRLLGLLPLLTKLTGEALKALRRWEEGSERPIERRLMNLEDQLRLKKITTEEYAAKRQEILKDL